MTRRRAAFTAAWAAVVAWMAVIFWFSAQPGTESAAMSGGFIQRVIGWFVPDFAHMSPAGQAAMVESWQTAVRKIAHMAEYALLGVLLWTALGRSLSGLRIRAVLTAGIGLVYAASDEIHQMFVPGRGPGVLDVLIDFAGLCAGLAACAAAAVLWRRHKTRHPSKAP